MFLPVNILMIKSRYSCYCRHPKRDHDEMFDATQEACQFGIVSS